MLRSLTILLSLIGILTIKNAGAQNSLLWEISGNGLEKPSYIFGTIHLIAQNDFVVRKEIDSVFDLSEQVAFEIKLDDPSLLTTFQEWIYLPSGTTIKDFCTEEEYQKLKKYFLDSLKTDIETLKDQKPFVLTQLQIADYATGESASFEIYFFNKCISTYVPIYGLEMLQDQLNIFDSIPYEEQMDMVINSANNTSYYQASWSSLIKAYKEEDINKLNQISMEVSPELIKYDDIFLDERNAKWVPVIESLVMTKSTFIAVGAAHLGGETGVLQLLKNRGYTLKQL